MAGVQPIDQASILQGGRNLVPNVLDQEIRRSLGQAQVAGMNAQTDALKAELAAGMLKREQEAQYNTDVSRALESNDPRALSWLIAKYPQQKDALKAAYDQMDALEQRSQMRDLAGLYSALQAGKTDVAIRTLETRITADRQAGRDTAEDEAQLALLKSGDPAAINSVKGRAALFIAAVQPEKFASVVEQLGGGGGQTKIAGYGDRLLDQDGNVLYTAPDAPFTLNQGDTRFGPSSGTGPQDGGPVLSGAQIETAAAQAIPGIVVTSGKRSPERNRMVGGVSNSFHLTDQARDFTPPPGTTMGQLASQLRTALPGMQVINEGDHVHVEPRTRTQASGPQAVASVPKAPEAKGRMMTQQEIAAMPGLDPGKAYWIDADGRPSAISGSDRGSLKPWPASALAARSDVNAALTNIEGALTLLDPKNKSRAAKTARDAIGFGTGMLGDRFTQWNNPEGTDARARIGQIGGLIIKDTSGAAVSLAEDQRLAKWVPLVTDNAQVAYAKLRNLKRELTQRNAAMDDIYSEDQGYRPFKGAAGPVNVRSIQEANALPPGTVYRAPDGKLRRR